VKKAGQYNKAWVGGIVAVLVPYILSDVLKLQMPPEVIMAINGLVVAGVVWLVPNVQRIADNVVDKLDGPQK
jgi:hypothetical protein